MNLQKITQSLTVINIDYIRGFFEADGCFTVSFSENVLKLCVKFSQKTNITILPLIQDFLAQHGISSTIDNSQDSDSDSDSEYEETTELENQSDTSKNRAPALRVQGINQIKKFLTLLENGTDTFIFATEKQRDLFIMRELVFNPNLTDAQCIGLKKSLHKTNQDEPDFENKKTVPRSTLEKRFGLNPGDSITESKALLTQIDNNYNLHQTNLKAAMDTNTLKVSPAYIAGLVDGDGCYYVTYQFVKDRGAKAKARIEWQGNFTLTMHIKSKLAVELFLYAINKPNHTLKRTKTKKAFQMWIRKQEGVDFLMTKHDDYPLLGDYRNEQLAAVKKLRVLVKTKAIKNINTVHAFLTEIHAISDRGSRGIFRKYTLKEAIKLSVNFL